MAEELKEQSPKGDQKREPEFTSSSDVAEGNTDLGAAIGCALVVVALGISASLIMWAAQGFPGL